MRRSATLSALTMTVLLAGAVACGPPPETPSPRAPSQRPTAPPTPTRSPSSGTLSDSDLATMLPEYSLARSGGYWIILEHLEKQETTVTVGLNLIQGGNDLEDEVADHRESIHSPPRFEHRGSGARESDSLGTVWWSWGTRDIGFESSEEIVIFARHPEIEGIMIARYECPTDEGDVQAKIDELLRVAEIVAPGL